MADDENTVTESNSMEEVSKKIRSAGEDLPEKEAEPVTPEPTEKTHQELVEDPNTLLNPDQTKDGLPLDQTNPEQLESIKDKSNVGDETIAKPNAEQK